MVKHTRKYKQELFIKKYLEYYGNITQACEEIGINRTTYYNWMEKDKFKEQIEAAFESFNDNIQQILYAKAVTGDKDLLKFWAKTQMRHRGFVEKQEIEHTGSISQPVTIHLIETSTEEIKQEIGEKRDNAIKNKDQS